GRSDVQVDRDPRAELLSHAPRQARLGGTFVSRDSAIVATSSRLSQQCVGMASWQLALHARTRRMKTRLNLATILAVGIVVTLFSACLLAARGGEPATPKASKVLVDLEKAKDRLAPGHRLAYRFAT